MAKIVIPKRKIMLKKPIAKKPTGYRSATGGSWLTPFMQRLANTRQLAMSLTPYCELQIMNASALYHSYTSAQSLVSACMTAVAGENRKQVTNGALSANLYSVAPTGATGALANFAAFGWRIRLTASLLNFDYSPFTINIGPVAYSATGAALTITPGTPTFTILATPRRLPVDILVLSASNAAGLATVVAGSAGVCGTSDLTAVNIPSCWVTLKSSSFSGVIESLNQRDFISRGNPCGARDAFSEVQEDAVYDAVYDDSGDEDDDDDDAGFAGIRDQ